MLIIKNEDISSLASNVKYSSQWNNGAGQLTFDYPTHLTKRYPNGSTVIFTYGEAKIFYGFLFTTKQDSKKYSCLCYDQLRYLKTNNSIFRPVCTLSEFVNTVALAVGERIRLGTVEDTKVKLSKYRFANQTHLDMLYQSIQDSFIENNYWYVLRDHFGQLELRDMVNLRLPIIIGDGSMGTGFEYESSIDQDTFNYIKVAKDDKKSGISNLYTAGDASTIKKWGKLIFYDNVSVDLNESQLATRANQLLQLKNRETQTLKVDGIGDTRVMGGSGVRVQIAEAGLDVWSIVESVTHDFSKNNHTMSMDLRFVW
ncbi:XkdQ/YqbQ family protein [Clostridium minihomine]|uniref:XkdQ/YqbQ family protein n=1 Tax=Clostridium minihomine TaxID=2045012 RepID=UPI000C78C077|nr:hypothetical protein [Clostridium minihomine]